MISAIVVDDEPLARTRLTRLLIECKVEVLGEVESASAALDLLSNTHPDLIFLDIQMPGISGVHFAPALRSLPHPPLIVFVSGYSDHAVNAFELEALDYLLKPVTDQRLSLTIARAIDRLQSTSEIDQKTESAPANQEFPRTSIPVKVDYAIHFFPIDSIEYVTTRNKFVYLIGADGKEARTQHRLADLEEMLPNAEFYRIHESSIVRLSSIFEISYLGDHNYQVILRSGAKLRVSRTRYAELLQRMGISK